MLNDERAQRDSSRSKPDWCDANRHIPGGLKNLSPARPGPRSVMLALLWLPILLAIAAASTIQVKLSWENHGHVPVKGILLIVDSEAISFTLGEGQQEYGLSLRREQIVNLKACYLQMNASKEGGNRLDYIAKIDGARLRTELAEQGGATLVVSLDLELK